MNSANEICRMDAVSLAKQIRTKKLSPVEVLDAVLDRIAKLDPILHAFSTLVPDQAREAAKQTEKAIMAGDEIGSLAGVPIGMKDLFFVKGVRTTFGSYVYKDFVPDEDDVAVERLRKAAVTILGQTNVPEFGYSGVGHNPIFETTRSPWNTNSNSWWLQCRLRSRCCDRHGACFDRNRWRRLGQVTGIAFWSLRH